MMTNNKLIAVGLSGAVSAALAFLVVEPLIFKALKVK